MIPIYTKINETEKENVESKDTILGHEFHS